MEKSLKKRMLVAGVLVSWSLSPAMCLADIPVNGGIIDNRNTGRVEAGTDYSNSQAQYGGGAVANWGSSDITFSADNVSFNNNSLTESASYGGAIYNELTSTVTIEGTSTFENNESNNWGGAIYNEGTIDFNGAASFIGNNSNNAGGAIVNEYVVGTTDANVNLADGSSFDGNISGQGGAIYNNKGELNVGSTSFSNNKATSGDGGAISNIDGGIVNVANGSSFSGNTASGQGGAIYNDGSLVLGSADGTEGITFTGNSAASGGDLYQESTANTLIQGASGVVSMDGGIAGAGEIIKTGENTFKVSGDNSGYTGQYTQESGKTIIDGTFFTGDSTFEDGALEFTNNAVLSNDINIAGAVDLAFNGGVPDSIDWQTGSISLGGYNINVDASTNNLDMTLGNISLSSDLSIGEGEKFQNLNLGNGANLTGAVALDNGTITIAQGASEVVNGPSVLENSNVAIDNSGSLTLDSSAGDITFSNNTTADIAQSATGTTSINASANTVTFNTGVSGAGSINKTGDGSVVFKGDSSGFTGAYTQSAGTINVDGEFISGTSTISGGDLILSENAALNNNITIAGVTNITVNGNAIDANGINWADGTIDIKSGALGSNNSDVVVNTGVKNQELTLDGVTLADQEIILGSDSVYGGLTINNSSSLTGSVTLSENGAISIDDTSDLTITSESYFSSNGSAVDNSGEFNVNAETEFTNNATAINNNDSGVVNINAETTFSNNDFAIINSGTLNLNSSNGQILFNGNDVADVYQDAGAKTTISGNNSVTFNKGLQGEGVVESNGNNVIFNGDSTDYTGTYNQTGGKTTVNGTFIGGETEVSQGIFALNGKLVNKVTVTGNNTTDLVISAAVDTITNDLTNGEITLNNQTGSFILGSNQVDLTLTSANNASTDITQIGTGVNINDLTFLGGAGLKEGIDLTVNDSALTFGSNTVNYDTNNVVLNNGTFNLGTANDGGLIDLNAAVSGTGEINKAYDTTVNVYSDNKDFTGNFTQTAGTTVLKEGSTFFGGSNTIKDGDLVVENGGRFAQGSVNNVVANDAGTGYATLVLQNETEKDYTLIDMTTGKVTLTDAIDGYSTDVQIDKAGLHLANGWVQDSNYEDGLNVFAGGTGIKEIEFSNGSGVLGNITAHDNSIVTYNDSAFVDDNSTIFLGDGAQLNLNYNEDTKFGAHIASLTSGGALSNINKNGDGAVIIDEDLGSMDKPAVNTNLNLNGGGLGIDGDVNITGDVNLSQLTYMEVNKGLNANSINANAADMGVRDNINLTGNINMQNDSALYLYGDTNTVAGNVSIADSEFAANNTVSVGNNLNISDSVINLSGGKVNPISVGGQTTLSGYNAMSFDADGRNYSTDGIVTKDLHINGTEAVIELGDINFVASPRDYNFNLQVVRSENEKTGGDLTIVTNDKIIDTPVGKYMLLSGAGGAISGSLQSINPQAYRGSVATVASYANQLVNNNIMFDHINIVSQQLIAQERTANKYASIDAQFSPYQYSANEGNLWYKAYGNFETISMTRGLNVHNNAYGSLIGADFPLITLKDGWKLIPTAYIAYNGAHQSFNGVSMYQNGGQIGAMGTVYKGNFLTSLLAYGGGYYNSMSVAGNNDRTGNWFAGVASKSAYNINLPADFIIQPTFLVSYNIFGEQNWHSNYGIIGMNSGMLNGINIAPGANIIWNKETFSLYATAQLVFNIMGDVDGKIGNIYLPDVGYRHVAYFEYGLGATKRIKERLNSFIQFTIRNGTRTGIGFQGGLQWKI